MGKRTNMARSHTPWEMSPGHTDLYFRYINPQNNPQIREAMKSMKLNAQM